MLKKVYLISLILIAVSILPVFSEGITSSGSRAQPMILNGDVVEYSTDAQEVTATGNVEILYSGSRLTCQKLTVNTLTKEGTASGNVRLEDSQGIVEGEKLIYNFQTHMGTIVDAQFRANPYFGKARFVEKTNESEFVARKGYVTTCSFDRPHYKISSKQINIVPQESIQTRDNYFYLGGFPLLYIPRFNRILEDPLMHWSVVPGKSKEWGMYVLSVLRFNIANNLDGRFYLDYRWNWGWSEGIGANYDSKFGKGVFKFYYTNQNADSSDAIKMVDQRYMIRYRHKWDIDKQTNFITEIVKVKDDKRKYGNSQSDFLQDYFFREFEKNMEPLTYAQFHHNFAYSSIDVLFQKRINHWYDTLDKLPEIKYTLPNIQLGSSPFHFENNTTLVTFNKSATTAPATTSAVKDTRLDTDNKLFIPMKIAFLEFSPFVKFRETVYDQGADGQVLPARTIFYGGADLSTKFYRLFDVKTDFMGLDINKLRHVITPSIHYSYNTKPTVSAIKLFQIDSVDLLTASNSASLELVNKLQTKRKDTDGKEKNVDLVEFDINTSYAFAPHNVYGTSLTPENDIYVKQVNVNDSYKLGASFQDVLLKFKILPYAWLRIEGDATYKHSGVPSDPDYANYNHFSKVDYDIDFTFAPERSFGFGQRYERKQGNQITAELKWRINPKWKFSIYQRYNLKSYGDQTTVGNPEIFKGSLEQQYTISRDLHCWEVDLTYSKQANSGEGLFVVFRLKAFPEGEFGFDQSYNAPKSGS
ncbi:MAG: hypothetical protein NTZ63_01860 [Candidatus Omnitrophica bacterium]|nr:hypothetical protein [Candidatus Omnitrophota bacterium]